MADERERGLVRAARVAATLALAATGMTVAVHASGATGVDAAVEHIAQGRVEIGCACLLFAGEYSLMTQLAREIGVSRQFL